MISLSNFRIKFCLSLKEPETTHSETAEWKTAIPTNGGRRSDACSEQICGRTSTFLYSEYRTAPKISEISRPTRRIYASTSEPTCEMDININGNRQRPTDNNKHILENQTTGNYKDLVRDDTNRGQKCEERFNTVVTGGRLKAQSSLPTGQEEEIDSNSGTLAIRELCGDQRMVTSSILQSRSTNQFPFNQDRNTGTLQTLQVDYTEFSEDHLLNILKKDYSFHDETNINVLSDREINKFSKVYGITDVHSILSCDDFVFWLEDNNGIIYIWSQMENSIILGGHDLREALMNFLFYQENLRYVDEYTHKLVPLDVS
ncbi:unnamed protein product [Rhizophagus irregularis]|nr:unnamed protein product [Rhizophagus irregularis]